MPKRKLSAEAAAGGEVDFMRPVFIRSCYAEYYERWLRLVAEDWDVTISGPEGSRTSDFFAYLFQRFRAEHPLKTTVAARFVNREIGVGTVFEAGTTRPWKQYSMEGEEYIHLYEGIPNTDPCETRWVSVAPLNWSWLRSLGKCSCHVTLFLPPWTLEELLDANTFLGLGLDDASISERFRIFGGAPDIVLSADAWRVRRARTGLKRAIAEIKSFEALSAYMAKFKKGHVSDPAILRAVPRTHPGCEPGIHWGISFLSPAVGDEVARALVDRSGADLFRFFRHPKADAEIIDWLNRLMSQK